MCLLIYPVMFFTVQEPHRRLVVRAEHTTEVQAFPPPEPHYTLPWEGVRDRLHIDRSAESLEAYQYVFDSPYVRSSAELAAYAARSKCAVPEVASNGNGNGRDSMTHSPRLESETIQGIIPHEHSA